MSSRGKWAQLPQWLPLHLGGWGQPGRYQRTPRHIRAVPVPGDPDALMERQIRTSPVYGEKLIELTDEPDTPVGDDAEAVWAGTALRMARLFTSAADDAFNDRRYRRLCRTYQRSARRRRGSRPFGQDSGWPSCGAVPRKGGPTWCRNCSVQNRAQPDDDAPSVSRNHDERGQMMATNENCWEDVATRLAAIGNRRQRRRGACPEEKPARVRCRLSRRSG